MGPGGTWDPWGPHRTQKNPKKIRKKSKKTGKTKENQGKPRKTQQKKYTLQVFSAESDGLPPVSSSWSGRATVKAKLMSIFCPVHYPDQNNGEVGLKKSAIIGYLGIFLGIFLGFFWVLWGPQGSWMHPGPI